MSETEQRAKTVLVVEDEAVVSRILQGHLEAEGYRVLLAGNAGQALRSAVTDPPDLMILDLSLIDGVSVNGLRDGLSLLQWVRRTLPEANFPVIIHTADTSADLEERAAASGVAAVFRKGGGVKDLLAAVRKNLDEREAA